MTSLMVCAFPITRCYLLALAVGLASPLHTVAGEVSFRNDVMAVLSKAGCNQGTCHGNARGKGGFQLSLRGDDPDRDFDTLTRDWLTRRTNLVEPDQSLLLLKATMQVAHAGGQRFAPESWEFQTLRDWIAAGLPVDDAQSPRLVSLDATPDDVLLEAPQWEFALRVRGRFSDGTERDLTSRAVYETGSPLIEVSADGRARGVAVGETVVLVRYLDRQVGVRVAIFPQRAPWSPPQPGSTQLVDRHIDAKLHKLKLPPSDVCDDATFVRRASLDLIGVLPTADEARQFTASTTADKRARLVDDLLARSEYADHWALKWADMLRLEEKTLDAKGTQAFHGWLRSAFAENRPLDELVRQLISARGSTYSEPPANFYRALRDPLSRSEAVAQLFLGARLQCAKCHNHPFDRWTQNDYYSWGNVFARVDYKVLENRRRDRNDKHEFDGEQLVFMADNGDAEDPRTGSPRAPKFLGDDRELSAGQDRLFALADWLTRPEHDRFAQMLVNRTWRHLMGRGLVEPVDDFRATNPATHPELLQALAVELRSSGFDLKQLLRVITGSQAYQRSSQPNPVNADDEVNYSHSLVRRLPAEQLLDGWMQACGTSVEFQGFPKGTRAGQLPGVGAMVRRFGDPTAADDALLVFGKPPRLQSCECERTDETTLAQAFQIVSGPVVDQLVTDRQNRVKRLLEADRSPAELVDELYWACLSRAPTAAEQEQTQAFVAGRTDKTAAWQDVLWGLITSHEFLLRR
jgi:hypothetical protein